MPMDRLRPELSGLPTEDDPFSLATYDSVASLPLPGFLTWTASAKPEGLRVLADILTRQWTAGKTRGSWTDAEDKSGIVSRQLALNRGGHGDYITEKQRTELDENLRQAWGRYWTTYREDTDTSKEVRPVMANKTVKELSELLYSRYTMPGAKSVAEDQNLEDGIAAFTLLIERSPGPRQCPS